MRKYNPETDYALILEALKATNSLTSVKRALALAGIEWPLINPMFSPRSSDAVALDEDICRASRELGLMPQPREFTTEEGEQLIRHGELFRSDTYFYQVTLDGWPVDSLGKRLRGKFTS